MSTLTKVLMVLNIIVAGVFIYLASSVWSGRQGWTYAVFQHTLALKGLPLEGEAGDGDYVPFDFAVNDALRETEIRKSTLEKLIPNGGAEFGGSVVNSQTAEIKRVQAKVLGEIDGLDKPAAKRAALLKYLTNIARSGEHRDGAFALLRDLFTQGRQQEALQEIPLLANQQIQVDSLRLLALVSSDAKADVLKARAMDLLRVTAPLAASGDSKEQREEALRNIKNIVADVEKAGADAGALAAAKKKLTDLASTDDMRSLLGSIIDLIGGQASGDANKKTLRDIALAPARSESEKSAINTIADLVSNPAGVSEEKALTAGKAILQATFEEAAAPATSAGNKTGLVALEKSRRIAHILYHLDADKADFATRADWHNRVAMVVGLNRYTEAASIQADKLVGMVQRLRSNSGNEDAVFRSDYLALKNVATELADRLGTLKLQFAGLESQKATHEENYGNRLNERKDLEQLLTTSQASAKKFLGDLAEREDEIFRLLNSLRDSKSELLQLEQKLRSLEQQLNR